MVERLLSTTSRWSRPLRDAERARSRYERSFRYVPRNVSRGYGATSGPSLTLTVIRSTGTLREGVRQSICGTWRKVDSPESCCSRRVSGLDKPLPSCSKLMITSVLTLALPSATLQKGSWDSIHVFEVRERSRQAHYSLTSTILLYLGSKTIMNEGDGDVSLSGTMTRQVCRARNRRCSPFR